MRFKDKLKKLMTEQNITQAQVINLTGIGKSSISQYLSGKNEPSDKRKRQIAISLGVQEDYFDISNNSTTEEAIDLDVCVNLPVPVAAKLMGKSREWIMQGLRDGVFPFGYAVKLKEWSYFISSIKFTEFTGIQIPTSLI